MSTATTSTSSSGFLARQVVVTGVSGSGRSTALRALEDLGYYCVDNLPAGLLPELHNKLAEASGDTPVAVGLDTRGGAFLAEIDGALGTLAQAGVALELIFLDCSDDVLVRRFAETRRRHPVDAPSIAAAIHTERALLASLRQRATRVIDTSDLNIHELKRQVQASVQQEAAARLGPAISILSFGFKLGVPRHAEYVFDLRFLKNPYFDEALRPMSGLDAPVSRYVLEQPEGQQIRQHVLDLLRFSLPRHAEEGRALVTVAFGCTGGQHRSVAMAESVAAALSADGIGRISIHHRDLRRGRVPTTAGEEPK